MIFARFLFPCNGRIRCVYQAYGDTGGLCFLVFIWIRRDEARLRRAAAAVPEKQRGNGTLVRTNGNGRVASLMIDVR